MSKYSDSAQSAKTSQSSQAESISEKLSASPEDNWSSVKDPSERRKIQNRIAQRKFREKVRQQREDAEREEENQRHAAGSYSTPEPEQAEGDEEGLPWGSFSLGHVIGTGKAKERSSRENSIYAAVTRAGGSSRVGLRLIDEYARGSPAWASWRARFGPYRHIQPGTRPWEPPPAARILPSNTSS